MTWFANWELGLADRSIEFFEKQLRDITRLSERAQKRRYFPTAREIVSGCAAYGGDIWSDLTKWHGLLVARGRRRAECGQLASLLEPAVLTRSSADLEDLCERAGDVLQLYLNDDLLRCAIYEVLLTENASADAQAVLRAACVEGLSKAWLSGRVSLGQITPGAVDQTAQRNYLRQGIHMSMVASQETLLIAEAQRRLTGVSARGAWADREMRAFVEDLHRSVHDDPEVKKSAEAMPEISSATTTAPARGIVVISKPSQKMPYEVKKLWDAFDDIADKKLPYVIAPHRDVIDEIKDRWPHAHEIVATLLGDVVADTPVRLRPTLLVGPPGCGKTSLAMAVAKALDWSAVVYSCTSVADNSFGGTASRWASAGPSVPLQQIRRSGVCNPLVVIDEIEKAPISDRYGSVVDVLLPMLEPHTASVYYESGLGVSADLSHVSYLATANTLNVSAPLRDRFRILRMPSPGREHLPVLCRHIVADLARERSQNGMIPSLSPDEEELVAKVWAGGSLRQLRRAVETLVTVRERLETRQ